EVTALSAPLAVAGQADRELGERPFLAVDRDRAAMLLRDDVVADREAEPGAFAGRLGREEGLEQLVADLSRDAGAVVAHLDLDRGAVVMRRDAEDRPKPGLAIGAGALVGGVEAVAEEVEEHPGDVLRHQLERFRRRVEIAFERDVEGLVLRPGAVIGEVQRLVDERVDVDLAPRECSSIDLTMLSARRPCSPILSRLPVSISIVSSRSARLSSSSVSSAGPAISFSSSSSSIDRWAKLLTKLSGFLISWAMPAVSWPSEAIFSACIRLACAVLNSPSAFSAASRAARISSSDRFLSVMSE